MKVLVTGAGGFLGSHLVELLRARGATVRAVVRRDDGRWKGEVETIAGDIRDADDVLRACAGVDTVFHTAARSGIWGSWARYYDVNVRGTRNVVSACLQQGVPRLVYTSSPSVTFDGGHQRNVDESIGYARRWLNHYSHTKALGEQHVLEANDPPRLMTCALRPHLIWGPGDRHLVPRLLERARSGTLRRVGDGRNEIDTLYIDNAVSAHWLAAQALRPDGPACGKAYFISQGDPVNCWQWINELLAMAGLPPVRRTITFEAAWRIGWAWEVLYTTLNLDREPAMTRFLASQLARTHTFDISRARRDLGYEPRVSIAEGMKRLERSL